MHNLLRKQIIFLLIFLGFTVSESFAQYEIYRPNHDDLTYYFGITLGYNSSTLRATKRNRFLASDSILSAEASASNGIVLGLLGTARLSDHFQIRINPQLVLGGSRSFTYVLGSKQPNESEIQKKILPSTLASLPIHIKFNSDRIRNFRMYVLGGARFDMDLSSNAAARNAEDLIKLEKYNTSVETGIGFNFFLPFVTISPELKFSYGITNVHARDDGLKYSNVFDKIRTSMFTFSLHFED
jgi:Outer membrane protein beta-barrel domain